MPSNLPSSFASAAAGQNTNRDVRSGGRSDGRGNTSGDWPRQGRSTNGTLTFRRSSMTPAAQASQNVPLHEPSQTPVAEALANMGFDGLGPRRYSKDELLSIFKSASENAPDDSDISSLLLPTWNPGHTNGSGARGWGKPGDTHPVPQEPEICWDSRGSLAAIGLQDMTAEEKELFSSDVNSPLKPPPQNKDNNQQGPGGLNGRKASLSHGSGNNYGLASPSSASRPGTRRRETTDTNPYSPGGLASPTAGRRDDGSFWFSRKNTDVKDAMHEEPEEDTNIPDSGAKQGPFGALLRNNTTGSSGLGGATAAWPPSAPSGIGSFGNFALQSSGSTIGDKRPGVSRGESRLAHLLPKDSSEAIGPKPGEPTGVNANKSWRARPRTDTDPFGEEGLAGSASLGGETSPPPVPQQPGRGHGFDTPVKGSAGEFGMSGLNIGGHGDQEPLSPSETNPYRSPPVERGDGDDGSDKAHGHGAGSDHPAGFGTFPRGFGSAAAFDGSDRSQTSSVGAKAFPPPLQTLGGWPSSATPDRERAPFGGAFGNALFGSTGDLQSPNLGNLGGVFGPGSNTGLAGSGSISRGSKLGSLFPPAMQAQMQSHEQDSQSLSDSLPDLRQANPLGAIGRGGFGDLPRDTDSPMRAGRGIFGDLFPQSDPNRAPGAPDLQRGAPGATDGPGGVFPYGVGTTAEPPSAQSRTMVMPDRMRWVYLDPQGNQQGPFTGLEMNDWYKAQFFTADLRVKKLEDGEFEPLGQLIRRIGNSREPFLVPQIGIAHGAPSQSGPFSPSTNGVIQPPLVGAFPSFGRTLTAEEQNNLERRKQEEQYLMARQREFLATQQAIAKLQLQGVGVPGLHHHSSAHSLHSQPSFGSVSSPMATAPQAAIGAIGTTPSFLDSHGNPSAGQGNVGSGLDAFREEELAPLSEAERQVLAGLQDRNNLSSNQHLPIGEPSPESGLRNQLPGTSQLQDDPEGFRGRLQEFEQLRAQHEAETAKLAQASAAIESAEAEPTAPAASHTIEKTQPDFEADEEEFEESDLKSESDMPMPFPAPHFNPALAAPSPQRIKSNIPAQFAEGSRSATPDTAASPAQPPPLAPWASTENRKGPSLKQIQEMEAIKAAKAEEAAAATRRAALEQEAAREREKATVAITTGLPMTSTWGTASPVSAGPSPWIKPGSTKATPSVSTPVAAPQSSDKKKTLADIQREEEARKQKQKVLAVQAGVASAAGKRYADLASKTGLPPQAANAAVNPPPGSGWATVGAGGKVKVPTGPSSQSRTVSASNVKPLAPQTKPISKPANAPVVTAKSEATDEFMKWLRTQLARGITGVNDIDNFANALLELPPMTDVIADAIYANSKTMDGRHFAEEFVRRKKLADKGVVEKTSTPTGSVDNKAGGSGGWNEVAKKGGHKESGETGAIQSADFKVVPSRKKGKK